MKNKKNIYILLPSVLIVWGILGYRIFSAVNPTNNNQEQVAVVTFTRTELQEAESFTINTNYRDPFLETVTKPTTVKKRKTKKAITKIPEVLFPNIIYKGVVSATGKDQQVFLISINGQQFFFKKNNTFSEIKLLNGNGKEVVLAFKGQRQTFAIVK